jgi:hypothetical protein
MNTKPKIELGHDPDQTAVAPDPFNVASLRLPPTFQETAGVRKIISTVPVRNPRSQEWFRVYPDEEYRGNFGLIILKEEKEHYLLTPRLVEPLQKEMTPVTIYTVLNRNGVLFLWPAKLSGGGHRNADSWNASAHEAAAAAMKRSVRMQSNMGLGAYEYSFSDNPTPENDPAWPELPFGELLRIAFVKTGCFVDNFDHPVIKMLRGL